jgi:protein dithiol oxidoreductase (disulfide-forming)
VIDRLQRRRLLTGLPLLALGMPIAAWGQFQPGRDFTALSGAAAPMENDGKIEVIEFFHYGCGRCAEFEPTLEAWAKRQPSDVRLIKVPTSFRLQGIDAVTLFYSLQALRELDRLHGKVFDAVHREGVMLGSPRIREQWLGKQGIAPEAFNAQAISFSVQSRQQRVVQLEKQFNVTSVPTLIVAGRYSVPNSATNLAIVDMLIAGERQAAAGKKK